MSCLPYLQTNKNGTPSDPEVPLYGLTKWFYRDRSLPRGGNSSKRQKIRALPS
jgi:hypothetical protein